MLYVKTNTPDANERAGYDTVVPMPRLEKAYFPDRRRIIEACERVMRYADRRRIIEACERVMRYG